SPPGISRKRLHSDSCCDFGKDLYMRGQRMVVIAAVAATIAALAYAQAQPAGNAAAADLKTLTEQVSYIVGSDMGKQFKQRGFEVDLDAMTRGLRDALADKPS